jgi:hypothetical protein
MHKESVEETPPRKASCYNTEKKVGGKHNEFQGTGCGD